MARNGSGTFSLVSGNPVTTGSTISSTWANNTLSDIATALTGSIAADGQTPVTANLPMSTYKHTGAGSATASGQYLVYGQSAAALDDLTLSGALNVTGASTFVAAMTMTAPSTVLLKDSTSFISDDGDATKKLAFQASGITTGTTRTWTVGNYSGIPAVPTNEGTLNQVLTSGGAGNQPTWAAVSYTPTASNALAGSIVQVVNTQTGAVATGTTTMPMDDTIPQNTEGTEFMTLAITPTSATNKLKITVVAFTSSAPGSGSLATVALFQDSTANAIAAMDATNSAPEGSEVTTFVYYMTAGTTSATTFKVRAGQHDAGTFTFNGYSSTRRYGGVAASSITIEEIKV